LRAALVSSATMHSVGRAKMPNLSNADGQPLRTGNEILPLARCPHCGIARPFLRENHRVDTNASGGHRLWWLYVCTTCGGAVIISTTSGQTDVLEVHPFQPGQTDPTIPERPREYLKQASDGIGQPMASIVMSAGAVDAMLKDKGLVTGSLYQRIDEAVNTHLITADMAMWAHHVRLDANDQRHADPGAAMPTQEDAKKCLDFALALAEVLFVLPLRVTRGIAVSTAPSP
jgi:hypothetical protein